MQKANTQTGTVVAYFGNSVAVEDSQGQVFQCHLRRNQKLPVVGDEVTWSLEHKDTGVIEAISPRRSLLAKGDARGKLRPIVANIDLMLVVMSPPPIFSHYLVDRYFIAAELLQIKPVLVVNKIDLLNETQLAELKSALQFYTDIGYPVILSSIYLPQALHEIEALINQQSAVLVGPSGVGKSSIINKITREEVVRVGEVSAKGSGKHTTTAIRLYHLPEGGRLIDSPGVREFTLWPITARELMQGFKEFLPYTNACKFRDCHHLKEPICGVKTAIEQGQLSPARYESYVELNTNIKK